MSCMYQKYMNGLYVSKIHEWVVCIKKLVNHQRRKIVGLLMILLCFNVLKVLFFGLFSLIKNNFITHISKRFQNSNFASFRKIVKIFDRQFSKILLHEIFPINVNFHYHFRHLLNSIPSS